MKKIRKTISILLSGLMVGLGFGSCGSQKQLTKQIIDTENQIEAKKAEIATAFEHQAQLKKNHAYLLNRIEELKTIELVYGPPRK